MKKQLQPNRWSCVATAFAIVLGEPIQVLIDEIGHDGSEILWPELRSPLSRRGFHAQELIECCLKRGRAVTPIESRPVLYSPEAGSTFVLPLNLQIENHLNDSEGVLLGKGPNGGRHAVAWDKNEIIDPGGQIINLEDFKIQVFYRISDSMFK